MDLKTAFRLLGRVGPVGRAVIDGLGQRGDLLLLDLAAARARLFSVLSLCMLAGGLALLAGFALTLAYAAAVWHRPDRGFLIAIAAIAYLGLTGLFAALAARKIRNWSPFEDTRAQLAEDRRCLNDLLSPDEPASGASEK